MAGRHLTDLRFCERQMVDDTGRTRIAMRGHLPIGEWPKENQEELAMSRSTAA